MNVLEVTYADRAGKLQPGSDDATKLEQAGIDILALQEAVQKLKEGTAKIYRTDTGIASLTSDEVKNFIYGNYDLLEGLDDQSEYVIASYSYNDDENQLCFTYAARGRIYDIRYYDHGDNTYTFDTEKYYILSTLALKSEVGTKLYRHEFSHSTGAGGWVVEVISYDATFNPGSFNPISIRGRSYGNDSTFGKPSVFNLTLSNAGNMAIATAIIFDTTAGTFSSQSISLIASEDTVTEL